MPKKSRSLGPKYTVRQSRKGTFSERDEADVVGVKAAIGEYMADAWENGYTDVTITITKNR